MALTVVLWHPRLVQAAPPQVPVPPLHEAVVGHNLPSPNCNAQCVRGCQLSPLTSAVGAHQLHQEQLYPNPSSEGTACEEAMNRASTYSTSWCQVETDVRKHEPDYHMGLHPACTSWCPTAWGACSHSYIRALPQRCQEMQICLAAGCTPAQSTGCHGVPMLPYKAVIAPAQLYPSYSEYYRLAVLVWGSQQPQALPKPVSTGREMQTGVAFCALQAHVVPLNLEGLEPKEHQSLLTPSYWVFKACLDCLWREACPRNYVWDELGYQEASVAQRDLPGALHKVWAIDFFPGSSSLKNEWPMKVIWLNCLVL